MKKLKEEMFRIDQKLKLSGRKRLEVKINKNENYYVYKSIIDYSSNNPNNTFSTFDLNDYSYIIYKVDKKKKRIYSREVLESENWFQDLLDFTIDSASNNYKLIRTEEEIKEIKFIKSYIKDVFSYLKEQIEKRVKDVINYNSQEVSNYLRKKKEKIIKDVTNYDLQEVYDLLELEELIKIKKLLINNKEKIQIKIKEQSELLREMKLRAKNGRIKPNLPKYTSKLLNPNDIDC